MKRISRWSFIYSIIPLIIYEITFAFFVLYYSQLDTIWFRAAYMVTGVALIVAFLKTLTCYKSWQRVLPAKKSQAICLLFYFASFIVYIFCLFILADGWYNPSSPPIIIFILLSIPPVSEFIIFLSIDRA